MTLTLLLWFLLFLEAREEILKKNVGLLEDLKTQKKHFEINWPLVGCLRSPIILTESNFHLECANFCSQVKWDHIDFKVSVLFLIFIKVLATYFSNFIDMLKSIYLHIYLLCGKVVLYYHKSEPNQRTFQIWQKLGPILENKLLRN